MKTIKTLFLWACLLGLAAPAARLVRAALTGGSLAMPLTSFNSGGGSMSGGSKVLAYTMGPASTAMSGGAFSMKPGVVSAVRPAQDNLQGGHAFPVPFKPSLGHDRLTFTRLATRTTIHVYTVSGQRVKTLTKSDGTTDTLIWMPVANEEGSPLASGVYFYVLSAPGLAPQKGKLMILK